MQAVYKRLIAILAVFIVLVMLSGYAVYSSYAGLNRQLVSRTSLLLGRAVEDALHNTTRENLDQLSFFEKIRLRSLMENMTTETGSIIHILLINTDMKILISSDPSIEGQQYKSSTELSTILRNQPLVLDKTWQTGIKVLDVILPLTNAQGVIFGYLRVVLSHSELTTSYKDLSFIFIPVIIAFGLLLAFSFYLAGRAYRVPLESIKDLVSRINEGDYSYRIDYNSNDEFTSTFKQLNKTIEKVSLLDESYKQATKRISTLLKAVDESIVVLDQDQKVSSFNEAAAEFFKLPQNENFPDSFNHLLSQNTELRALLREAKQTGRAIEKRELTLWLKESELVCRTSIQLYLENESVTSYLLSFKDVESLKELENNLTRSMKFGVIAGLASSISHEIKNPLSSMAIHADILNTRLGKIDIPDELKLKKSLEILQTEVKRLNRITSQFFNLARVKRSDLALINLNSVIKDVLFLVQQQSIERNIQLKSELADAIDFIYGDPDQLKQVFLNILLNAFQAIDRDGLVHVRSRQEHQIIIIEIEDNGKGIAPEEQEHIFELYFSTKADGGGIGLAVSKDIIQAHEGQISFTSQQGQGTVFTLHFPRKEKTTQLNIPVYRK